MKFVCAFWQTYISIDLCMYGMSGTSTQICMRCAEEPISFFILAPEIQMMFFSVYLRPLDKKVKFVCAVLSQNKKLFFTFIDITF